VTPLEQIVARLNQRFTDPAKRELLAVIAADATTLAAQALTNSVDVAVEAQHIKAQTANLTAEEAAVASNVIFQGLSETIRQVVLGSLTGN